MPATHLRIEGQDDGSILLWIKAVPGTSRDQIAGVLGDRLKIRIAAPPEDGKADKAICALLAKALAIKSKQIEIHSGHSSPEKVVRIIGVSADEISSRLR